MPELVVGLDSIAFAREARRSTEPDPAAAAVLAELAGAGGVSLSLRTDRRTGQERDAKVLRAVVRTRLFVRVPPTPEALKVVAPIRPDHVVLAPERPDTLVPEGHDLTLSPGALGEAVATLKEAGLECLVAIEPDPEQVKAVHRLGAAGACIVGNRLGSARLPDAEDRERDAVDRCVRLAARLGLLTMVSHGLSLRSLALLRGIEGLRWVEAGHAVASRAMLVGMDRAVRDARQALG
jgi:pyridoxine 5-phosphate synthase